MWRLRDLSVHKDFDKPNNGWDQTCKPNTGGFNRKDEETQ